MFFFPGRVGSRGIFIDQFPALVRTVADFYGAACNADAVL